MTMTSLVGWLGCPDGQRLLVRAWLPAGHVKGAVQLCHGMAEHSRRYAELAELLTEDGWAVYAHDHRGHGGTAWQPFRAGRFARHDGWNVVVEDTHRVHRMLTSRHPGLPTVLIGHSMGSLIARDIAIRWSSEIDGLVLSGNAVPMGWRRRPGLLLVSAICELHGAGRPSRLLNRLNTGSYARAIRPRRTDFDWLSREPAEVDAYLDDPWCGFDCSAGFYRDLLVGIGRVDDQGLIGLVRPDLPILVTSGSEDPVGRGLAGMRSAAAQYRRAGVRDVSERPWPGARHELFHETNRAAIMAGVRDWLDSRIPG